MYFITFIASPKKPNTACGTFQANILTVLYIILFTDQSVWIRDLPYIEFRVLAEIFL